MITKVTGCIDCPLCSSSENISGSGFDFFCAKNSMEIPSVDIDEDFNGDPITPDDCPLKNGPITVELEGLDNE